MGKITKGKAITISARASKLYNLKGNDGEWLDAESWRQEVTKENITRTRTSGDSKKIKKIINHANEFDGIIGNKKSSTYDKQNPHKDFQNPLASENVLHEFATYNTLFTLSGVNEQELESGDFLTNPIHDVVARSGGIGENTNVTNSGDPFIKTGKQSDVDRIVRQAYKNFKRDYSDSIGILGRGHDIFFENVNLLSTVSPSEERSLADFVKMEFKLHEPYSVTFIEKVRAATRLNGYLDYQDAPLLLTIEFKGFDENGKQRYPYGTVRKIPILITRVDLDVNEGGAVYDVTAVRIQDIAFDDRFKFPRGTINLQGDTPADVGFEMAKRLKEIQEIERDEHKVRQKIDTYEFEMDEKVGVLAKEFGSGVKTVHANKYDGDDGFNYLPARTTKKVQTTASTDHHGHATSLHSVVKMWEDTIRSGKYFYDLATDFWTTYLRGAGVLAKDEKLKDAKQLKKIILDDNFEQIVLDNQYVDWFKIKTEVKTHSSEGLDNITKMHRKTIRFKAVHHKIHVLKLIKPGISMETGAVKKLARRVYNYIYTGENVDVQNLRINYKTAYYMRNVIDPDKPATGIQAVIESLKTAILGKEEYPEPNLPLRQYPSIIKGQNLIKVTKDQAKSQEFYDYLTNPVADMMRIELTILGDPAYICQDQFVPASDNQTASTGFDKTLGSFNSDFSSPLILLNYRLPDDIDEKNEGVMFSGTDKVRDENLFFSGVYQVVKIESSIESGQFLQTLTCVRLNNQNGEGLPAEVLKSSQSKLLEVDKLKDKASDSVKGYMKGYRRGQINKIKDYI